MIAKKAFAGLGCHRSWAGMIAAGFCAMPLASCTVSSDSNGVADEAPALAAPVGVAELPVTASARGNVGALEIIYSQSDLEALAQSPEVQSLNMPFAMSPEPDQS